MIKSLFNTLGNLFYSLKYGIHNLVTWFGIIWNLRENDYIEGVDLFVKYLKLFRERLLTHHNSDNWCDIVNEINYFLTLEEIINTDKIFEWYSKEAEKLDPEDEEGRSKLFDLCKEEENRTKDEAYQFLKDHIGGWWD